MPQRGSNFLTSSLPDSSRTSFHRDAQGMNIKTSENAKKSAASFMLHSLVLPKKYFSHMHRFVPYLVNARSTCPLNFSQISMIHLLHLNLVTGTAWEDS